MRFQIIALAACLAAACSPPSPQPGPDEEATVNGTIVDQSAPEGVPGSDEAANNANAMGDIHAVEQSGPENTANQFANLLSHKQFADAFNLVDSQAMGLDQKDFEAKFATYKTIAAAIGEIEPTEGAAGSLYSQMQLTLSGNRNDGSPYAMTGPITLRRVNDVPGSTAEQRRWHIVKMELTADPKAAEKLVQH